MHRRTQISQMVYSVVPRGIFSRNNLMNKSIYKTFYKPKSRFSEAVVEILNCAGFVLIFSAIICGMVILQDIFKNL